MDKAQEHKIKVYDSLCHQIEREDGLISTRVGWMLTFEGFLFAALALISNKPDTDVAVYWAMRCALPIVGILVGVMALFAVNAALRALEELKLMWVKGEFAGLPPPYGGDVNHSTAARYAKGLPFLMIVAWSWILVFFVAFDLCTRTHWLWFAPAVFSCKTP